MHKNEISIDMQLIRQLLIEQFPQYSEHSIKRIQSDGTDNAIFRLGPDLCIRMPRIKEADKQIILEQQWLPKIAPSLPLATPTLIGKGHPNNDYPLHWSIYRWLKGCDAFTEENIDLNQSAIDFAHFILDLQKIDTINAPLSRRGTPLIERDTAVRQIIEALKNDLNPHTVTRIWEDCLQAPTWDKPSVWTHGDLLPANLLIQKGRLSAVIDFGLMGIGDPACDLIPAWSLFTGESRTLFRRTLNIDDATWMRGRGWALSIALIIIPYYKNTNPGLTAVASKIISEILSEL